ncbi:MAG: radical SAM protein [candidate division KSB1 bacterium]|nr:radical SAM protein [candidate division KSB1 bacterium]
MDRLRELLSPCQLCPRRCLAERLRGKTGTCRAGARARVASAFPHFGEEDPLVGWGGSGTIFLSHCNLRCVFCQNYDISHYAEGKEVEAQELASLMLALQRRGCHNINFVTPTHYVPQIVEAVALAVQQGLQVPIVYNCGGYESLDALRLLEGIVDIYMPDVKFFSPELSQRYCHAPDYFEVASRALLEMYRQVGDLRINRQGLAERGVLIRHLVMPNAVEDSKRILEFIAREVSRDAYVNIMAQYRPCHQAFQFPEIARPISLSEYREVVRYARSIGLHRGFPDL